MKEFIVKNARVVDPSRGIDEVGEICVKDGVFCGSVSGAAEVIDAKGLVLVPGFVDMHVHMREPGQTSKESIATGTAAAGGWIHFRDGDAQYVPRGGFSVNNPPYKRYYF